MYYIRFGAYPNHTYIQIIVKNNLMEERNEGRKGKKTENKKITTAQIRD
jgi:hypothetical protein